MFDFLFILVYVSCVVYLALRGLSITRKQLLPYESFRTLAHFEALKEERNQGEFAM